MGGRQANQDGKRADGGAWQSGPALEPNKTGGKPPAAEKSKRPQPRQ